MDTQTKPTENSTLSAIDFAKFFIWKSQQEGKPITNKKLQKLLYYAQAWNLVFNGKPLFPEKIQAWIHGPAIKAVYDRYKSFSYKPIEESVTKADIDKLPAIEVLEDVWNTYGKFDADYLEVLTHNEDPWQIARDNLEGNQNSENEISLESIAEYYAKKLDESEKA